MVIGTPIYRGVERRRSAGTAKCKHLGELTDTVYETAELLDSMEMGRSVFITGVCSGCKKKVKRVFMPVTTLDNEIIIVTPLGNWLAV